MFAVKRENEQEMKWKENVLTRGKQWPQDEMKKSDAENEKKDHWNCWEDDNDNHDDVFRVWCEQRRNDELDLHEKSAISKTNG